MMIFHFQGEYILKISPPEGWGFCKLEIFFFCSHSCGMYDFHHNNEKI